ncbi:MAG: NAD-dependent epimerase/dehydratase family protein [bacterium]|nr:NAD-dependent epimerase/dehydratase family protein [bacterium]
MNIAIIGSNGFIGRHLTQALLKDPNNKVFLFGKNSTSFFKDKLPYTKIDLTDATQVNAHFASIDVVYYLASESIPSTSWHKPMLEIELNLIPFIQFMECISQLNVKKLAFVSSAGTVYGANKDKVGEDAAKSPFSPYGITKLTMEYYLNYYTIKYGIHADVFRVSNVYGPGQDTSKGLGIINTFLEHIIRTAAVTIFGNGENIRNYIYIHDLAELLTLSVISPLSSSNTYNLSSDDTLTINALVSIMKKVVDEDFRIHYKEMRESDNSIIVLDNTKIKNALPGFRFTTLEKGIEQTYKSLKGQLLKNN